jgi:hypothetical protein
LNYKFKADLEAKGKMEEKLKFYETIEEQINEVKRMNTEASANYEACVE